MMKLVNRGRGSKSDWRIQGDSQDIPGVSIKTDSETKEPTSVNIDFPNTSESFLNESIVSIANLFPSQKAFFRVNNISRELAPEITELKLSSTMQGDEEFPDMYLTFRVEKEKAVEVDLSSSAFLFNVAWTNPFSLHEYLNAVRNNLPKSKKQSWKFSPELFITISDSNLNLNELILFCIREFKVAHRNAVEQLTEKIVENTLTTRFYNFPEEIRTPCEQYLLYFTEFLRDLGISATSDIKHEAGEILFSVTPANPDQALDKIRVALEAFLSLPRSEIIIDPDPEFEIAMHKVKANIDYLNSQLSLAKAEIRVKERELQAFEAIVEAKDISIEFLREKLSQQKRLLNGEIAQGIIEFDPKPLDDDKEEFFSGIVALRKYEEKGVSVNLAQLYRRLRDFFK